MPPASGKILLILDLDETLIHATAKPVDHNWAHEVFGYKVYVRPGLYQFLENLQAHYDVAVWSSASDDYVKKVVELVFPANYPLLFVWGRSRCTYKPDYNKAETLGYFDPYSHFDYIKRLEKVFKRFPYRKEKILIVDDTPRKCMYNYGNAIYPSEFNGSAMDDELIHLGRYLEKISQADNVRNIEKRGWRSQVLAEG